MANIIWDKLFGNFGVLSHREHRIVESTVDSCIEIANQSGLIEKEDDFIRLKEAFENSKTDTGGGEWTA